MLIREVRTHSIDWYVSINDKNYSNFYIICIPFNTSKLGILSYKSKFLGFLLTTVELFLAYGIILLTVLSLCALSSNGAVEGQEYTFNKINNLYGI